MTKNLTDTTDIAVPPPSPDKSVIEDGDWLRLDQSVCAISDWREMYMQYVSGEITMPDKVLMF
ncbi:MAG: hypothetical protein MI799_22470, partial [Desulfobacterales bacterium]|nr:hypothetical protein [Desulfobacterales bacterium]